MGRVGYVYILASKKGGTLYTGVTSDLARRVYEHEIGVGSKFTAKYGAKRLVWFQEVAVVVKAFCGLSACRVGLGMNVCDKYRDDGSEGGGTQSGLPGADVQLLA